MLWCAAGPLPVPLANVVARPTCLGLTRVTWLQAPRRFCSCSQTRLSATVSSLKANNMSGRYCRQLVDTRTKPRHIKEFGMRYSQFPVFCKTTLAMRVPRYAAIRRVGPKSDPLVATSAEHPGCRISTRIPRFAPISPLEISPVRLELSHKRVGS